MGENIKKKYESNVVSKKRYNSNLSSFQISKILHNDVKDFCKRNNLNIKDFLEKIIIENLNKQN